MAISKLPPLGDILKETGRSVLLSLQGVANFGNQFGNAITKGVLSGNLATRGLSGTVNSYNPPAIQPKNQYEQAIIKGGELGPSTAVGVLTGQPFMPIKTALGFGGIGGIGNKIQGGSFTEGFLQSAEQGYKSAPLLQGITGLTNPIISKGINSFTGDMSSPINKFISNRLASGVGNTIQGVPISTSMGQTPTLGGAGVDFLTGTLFGPNQFSSEIKSGVRDYKFRDKPTELFKKDAGVLDSAMDILQGSKKSVSKDTNLIWKENAVGSIRNLSDMYLSKEEIDRAIAKTKGKSEFAYYKELGRILQSKGRSVAPDYTDVKPMGMGIVDGQPKSIGEIIREGGESVNETKPFENPTDPYFNVNRLSVDDKTRESIKKVVEEVKPQIEKVVGKTLSNEEAVSLANKTSKTLDKTVGRQQTLEWEAMMLKTRQKLAELGKSGKVDKDYLDTLVAVKSLGTDIARKLQSFSIDAVPSQVKARNQILQAVLDVTKDTDEVLKVAESVNFNNAKEAADFYRTFIKPTKSEFNDLLRYNSMLSSPNTHINNSFSNLVNSGIVAPIEKTIVGGLDFLGSLKTGERSAFVGEGPAYVKGYVANLKSASSKFIDVLKDKSLSENLDINNIPLSKSDSRLRKYENALRLPTKLLEGMDQFFTELTVGGESEALKYRQSKGVKVGSILEKSRESATYRLFRSELFREGQGTLLDGVDEITSKLQGLRSSKNPVVSNIAKFTLPFVRTPMNMFKQGIEYSPAGVLTLKGSSSKKEQLAKVIIGSSAAAATAMLAGSDRLTWSEPTDSTKKAAFRAAGMQPYSVKVGDKWVSFAKLPPALSFPMALTAALHDAQKNARLDDTQIDNVLAGIAKWGNFFSDQSYLKNIGDILAATKGDIEGVARFVSNYPMQEIPFRALLGWAARLSDPYQRKVDTDQSQLKQLIEQIKVNLPGLSQTVPARVDKFGTPIPSTNRILNSFSPVKATTENPQNKSYYDMLVEQSKMRRDANDLKKSLLKGDNTTNKAFAEEVNNGVDINSIKQQEKKYKLLNSLWDKVYLAGGAREDVAGVIKKAGIDPVESEYNYLSGESVKVKSAYIKQVLEASKNPIRTLVELRKDGAVTNSPILTNTIIDEFSKNGVITSKLAIFLKKTYYDPKAKTVKIKTPKSSRGRKSTPPKLKISTVKLPKVRVNKTLSGQKFPVLESIKAPKLL